MAYPFVAEIRIFPYNFAPSGWALCNGQVLSISQNTALFSLLGTNYGGNGQSTFALPDLTGRFPMHYNQGPGLSERFIGEASGTTQVTLEAATIPSHTHALLATTGNSPQQSPAGVSLGRSASKPYAPAPSNALLGATQAAGGSLPHNNMPPFLTLQFCIALQGVFPPRS